MRKKTQANDKWLDNDLNDRLIQILKAAEELFAEKSFRYTEVADIAHSAGMSKATIYKYFASKDKILLKIVEENFKYIRDIVLLSLLTGTEPPLQRLQNAALKVAAHLDSHKSFVHVLIKDAGECMPEIQRMHHTIMNANSKVADALFTSLRQDGEIPDIPASDLLRIVSDICIGALYSWVLSDSGTLVDSVKFYFRFLFPEGAKPQVTQ